MTNSTSIRSHKNPSAHTAMRWAWRLARRGRTLYGGSVRAYLSEALRIAWAELKADPTYQECCRIIAEIRARRARLGGQYAVPSCFSYNATGGAWIGR